MGNFKFGYNFLDYTPVASSEDTNYPASNLKDYAHLARHSRTLVKTECTYTCNFGSAKTLAGILLNDVNFTDAYIEGSANGSSWTYSVHVTITEDKGRKRYGIYTPLTAFSYQYFRIRITAQDPVARYPDAALSVFRIGTLVLCQSALEFTQNPSYPYNRSFMKSEPLINEFLSGGREKISTGDLIHWEGDFSFDLSEIDVIEDEILEFNAIIDQVDYMVFFENRGNNSKSYLCQKDTTPEISESSHNIMATGEFKLTEVV